VGYTCTQAAGGSTASPLCGFSLVEPPQDPDLYNALGAAYIMLLLSAALCQLIIPQQRGLRFSP
jgi:hypothetical protein